MIIILGIVGVFTHLNPIPQNEPLEWYESDDNFEFTTSILPKKPGDNHFVVVANSNKEEIEIKRIELFLKYKDNPDIAPIQVPFTEVEQSKNVQYMIDGKYIAVCGKLDSRGSNIRIRRIMSKYLVGILLPTKNF